MSESREGLEFYSARVFVPNHLLPLAGEAFTAAHLHPMPRDRDAVLRLSGQNEPIAGRFVELAGTAAAVDSLAEILTGLGLPPKLFAPICWGEFNSLSHP